MVSRLIDIIARSDSAIQQRTRLLLAQNALFARKKAEGNPYLPLEVSQVTKNCKY